MNQQSDVREHRALSVVDVQRDFCPGGALPVAGCERILPAIAEMAAGLGVMHSR